MKSELRFQLLVVGRGGGDEHARRATPFRRPRRTRWQAPESFASIADTDARSAAMFTELGKVLTHPRCINCHPAGDRPRQGDESRLHQPPVTRGADGHGLPAMRCSICHQNANFDPGRMPGHPEWHLAPREMAWEGKTVARDLRADQGSGSQWRPQGRRTRPSYRRRHAGRLGLGARVRPQPRSRHAEAGRRAGRGLGENGSCLSREIMITQDPRQ